MGIAEAGGVLDHILLDGHAIDDFQDELKATGEGVTTQGKDLGTGAHALLAELGRSRKHLKGFSIQRTLAHDFMHVQEPTFNERLLTAQVRW